MSTPKAYIRAVYGGGLSSQCWLQGVAAASRPVLDAGHGVAAWSLVTRERTIVASAVWSVGVDALVLERMEPLAKAMALTGPAARDAEQGHTRVGLEYCGHAHMQVSSAAYDVVLLVACGGEGDAIVMAAPRLSGNGCVHRERARYERMARHLACALRLRRLPGWQGVPTSGSRDHNSPALTQQQALRNAAITSDERCKAYSAPDATAAALAWQNLLQGKLTCLDSFEREGRRYILTCEGPASPARGAPTSRQCHMIALRSLGHPLKYIAAELDCSLSTVSREIGRGLRLLGVRTAGELGILLMD